MEKELNIENLYDPSNIETLHCLNQAVKAHAIFKNEVDYVVREGEVVIIDEFTGRMMTGRRYSDGLEISRANKRAGRPREWAHKPAPKGKWPFATMLAVS